MIPPCDLWHDIKKLPIVVKQEQAANEWHCG